MDCFTLSLIYLAVVGVLLIFEGGYLYGLFITVVFLYWTTFKREAWDESIAPYISAIIYLIVWMLLVSHLFTFWLALLILVATLLVFLSPGIIYLIYDNWDVIKEWFKEKWTNVRKK